MIGLRQLWSQHKALVLGGGGAAVGGAILLRKRAQANATSTGNSATGSTPIVTAGQSTSGAVDDTTAQDLISYFDQNQQASNEQLQGELNTTNHNVAWLSTQRAHLAQLVGAQRSEIATLQHQQATGKKTSPNTMAKTPLDLSSHLAAKAPPVGRRG